MVTTLDMRTAHNDTEFGQFLWSVVKKPTLPTKVLKGSPLTKEGHNRILSQWQATVEKKNETGRKKGLSLDDFVNMVNDFFDAVVLNRSALHRLIQTANPIIEGHAKTISADILMIVSYFSHKTYEEMEQIGLRTIEKTKAEEKEKKQQQLIASMPQQPLYQTTITPYQPISQPQPRHKIDSPIRRLVHNYVNANGYREMARKGISEQDILELLYEPHPKVDMSVLVALPAVLGITPEHFLSLLTQSANQG